MRSTLFYLPHDLAGVPVFGFGLLFGLLVLGFVSWAAWKYVSAGADDNARDASPEKSKASALEEILAALPILVIAAAVVVWLLPNVEQRWSDGTPIGLPIRGYGLMVVLGLFAGMGITVVRAKSLGVSPDTVIGLGFWMMLVGVLGARTFFVVQNWNDFETWAEVFQVTEGGLVIYGGVIGGLIAGAAFCYRNGLHVLAVADLIAPGFLLGQSLGRVGCLLHGCCFGGVCDVDLPTLRFPAGSGPYQAQLSSGRLLGIETTDIELPSRIETVEAKSLAASRGVLPGQNLAAVFMSTVEREKGSSPTEPEQMYAEAEIDGKRLGFFPQELPLQSLATHPSQIYSAINALLLCILIWFLQPLPGRDGMVFCTAILLYTTSRFLMELVRSDEAGQLGTSLTIAQILSIGAIICAGLGLLLLRNRPAGRVWKWA